MSRLFEKFVEEVLGSNPYLYAEAQRIDAESKEAQYIERRNEITPENSTTEEWCEFGKPNLKNQLLKH